MSLKTQKPLENVKKISSQDPWDAIFKNADFS